MDMDIQTKIYILFSLIGAFILLQMHITRKKAFKKTAFPFMVNSFRADYTAMNPLRILYYVSYGGVKFEERTNFFSKMFKGKKTATKTDATPKTTEANA